MKLLHAKPAPRVTLTELRQQCGITQAQLAEDLATSQKAVLKMERSEDPVLSTLRRYVAAVGACSGSEVQLEIIATVGGKHFRVEPPERQAAEPIADGASAWRLRAWDDAGLEQRFIAEHAVAISNDELGDLTAWPGDDVVRDLLRDLPGARGEQAIGTFVGYWRAFRNGMEIGDVVVVPLTGKRAAIGTIESDYVYVPAEKEPDPRMRHRHKVAWLKTVLRADLDDDLRGVVNAPGTICRFGAVDAAQRLLEVDQPS